MSSKLKEERLRAGYTIEEISEKLNIRKRYLIDLEEENYHAIPGQIYVDGYTKLYAEFLGIESARSTKVPVTYKPKRKKKLIGKKNLKKYILLASATLLVLTFILYGYLRTGTDHSAPSLVTNEELFSQEENDYYQEQFTENDINN